eukprot:11227648-Lingulodinium_polyedra.AAC.1
MSPCRAAAAQDPAGRTAKRAARGQTATNPATAEAHGRERCSQRRPPPADAERGATHGLAPPVPLSPPGC